MCVTEHPVVLALAGVERQAFCRHGLLAWESSKRTRQVADRLSIAKEGKRLAISLR